MKSNLFRAGDALLCIFSSFFMQYNTEKDLPAKVLSLLRRNMYIGEGVIFDNSTMNGKIVK